MEFGHAVVAGEEVADAVTILEGFHMFPEGCDAGDFDVDFGVVADALHDFVVGGELEVDGLAIALDDGICWRFQGGGEAQDVVVEGHGLVHVGDGQHGTYSSYDGVGHALQPPTGSRIARFGGTVNQADWNSTRLPKGSSA